MCLYDFYNIYQNVMALWALSSSQSPSHIICFTFLFYLFSYDDNTLLSRQYPSHCNTCKTIHLAVGEFQKLTRKTINITKASHVTIRVLKSYLTLLLGPLPDSPIRQIERWTDNLAPTVSPPPFLGYCHFPAFP